MKLLVTESIMMGMALLTTFMAPITPKAQLAREIQSIEIVMEPTVPE
jgi:hypothetical protein